MRHHGRARPRVRAAGQHRADVAVGGEIEDLLALPLAPARSRRAQQPQMMAHERRRQTQRLRNRAHRPLLVDASEHDAQARRVAEQAKQVGERDDAVVGAVKLAGK